MTQEQGIPIAVDLDELVELNSRIFELEDKIEDLEIAVQLAYVQGKRDAYQHCADTGYDYDRPLWEQYATEAQEQINALEKSQ